MKPVATLSAGALAVFVCSFVTTTLTTASTSTIHAIVPAVGSALEAQAAKPEAGWVSLFDGKSLDGWKASDAPGTFSVQNGTIVVFGPRSHLFYDGPVQNHQFTNFEWKADVMTTKGSNSGMYFHTEYQAEGWPSKGYEVQVNSTHTDTIRTGSLYGILNVTDQLSRDDEWFTQQITVQGKRVVIKVNDKVTVDYTEPDNVERPRAMVGRRLGSGTFALQGHDPTSKVSYKNIQVKPLP